MKNTLLTALSFYNLIAGLHNFRGKGNSLYGWNSVHNQKYGYHLYLWLPRLYVYICYAALPIFHGCLPSMVIYSYSCVSFFSLSVFLLRLFPIKGSFSDLRQFLSIESPLKMMKNAVYFMLKALFDIEIYERRNKKDFMTSQTGQ